jgi:hypothetical protein
MSRKLMLGFISTIVAVLVFAPSAFAQTGGGCKLDGTASFTPGLNASAQDFSYSFNGDLTSCQSNVAGAPTTGTVSAGEVVTINGQQFQEPVPSGNGGCSNSTTGGTAIVSWSDGTKTVVTYSTSGVAAGVALQGSVAASVTLPAVNPQPGQPTSTTVTTTRYAGATALGALTFQPPDPTACETPAGVTSAAISGVVALGNS